eukprot:gb/GFBE01034036.1/.p1 GENE.gb/GFBE01034036.1/~~gb/GFBE01034036.1/.p1  ORF type:complete len:258 (+),score=16.55 gb/GFBE01034036.1/:1-774(+)
MRQTHVQKFLCLAFAAWLRLALFGGDSVLTLGLEPVGLYGHHCWVFARGRRKPASRAGATTVHSSYIDTATALQMLGLDLDIEELSADELKRAYRQQALKWHPDKCDGDATRFLDLTRAYKLLAKSKVKPLRRRKRRRRTSGTDVEDVSETSQGTSSEYTDRLWEEIRREVDVNVDDESYVRANKYVENSLVDDVERLAGKQWPSRQPRPVRLGVFEPLRGFIAILANLWFLISVFVIIFPNFRTSLYQVLNQIFQS